MATAHEQTTADGKSMHTERGIIWSDNDINFPYVLEDGEVEAACVGMVVDRQRAAGLAGADVGNVRCLTTASGGDTVLMLACLPEVGSVDGCDLNYGQWHCCLLKEALFLRFGRAHMVDDDAKNDADADADADTAPMPAVDELLRFVANPHNAAEADADTVAWRTTILDEELARLPETTRIYWNDEARRRSLLRHGLHSIGFRQTDCVGLVTALRNAGMHPYEHADVALADDDATKAKWNALWSANLLTKFPGAGARLGNIVRDECRAGRGGNWFVRSFVGWPHASAAELPRYLRTLSRYCHGDTSKKVSFHWHELTSFMNTAVSEGRQFDFIHMSTILDGVKQEVRDKLLTAIRAALSSTGVALFRSGPFPGPLNTDRTLTPAAEDGAPPLTTSGLRTLLSEYFAVDARQSDAFRVSECCRIYFDTVVVTQKQM